MHRPHSEIADGDPVIKDEAVKYPILKCCPRMPVRHPRPSMPRAARQYRFSPILVDMKKDRLTLTRPYDELLMMGHDRWVARDIVADKIDRILAQWEAPEK